MKNNFVSQGNIYMCDFGNGKGSEQRGTRPAIVVSSNVCNQFSSVVVVIPLTSKIKAELPVHYTLYHTKYHNLKKAMSIVLCEQIRAVDKTRIGKFIEKVDKRDLIKIIETINNNFIY